MSRSIASNLQQNLQNHDRTLLYFQKHKFTLTLLPLTIFFCFPKPAIAQLIPDNTLGAESSVVTPLDALTDRIDGGAIRGSNLFHSFQDFNIDDGRGAFFNNPAAIENILTRVTGGNPSNIFGMLGVLGDANLFLVNPNGIVFGPNARLDVGGSFFASTAEGILFPDGYEFSTTNPDAPPLLTINVPIGLQFGANPGGIVNQSVATNDAGDVHGLSVPSGETLALVGGNVTLDGGNVQPRGGRVELGGLAGVGTVGVNADGSLSFPEGVERADVVLENGAEVNVRAGDGGSITVRARNFQMSGGSVFRAGIESGMGAPGSQAGDIWVEATDTTTLREESQIFNGVLSSATGNGGNVDLNARSFSATDSNILAFTDGLGNGGRIALHVTDTLTGDNSVIQNSVFPNGVGNVAGIDVSAGSLILTNGAALNSFTQGRGDTGTVTVRATDTISFDGLFSGERAVSGGINNSVEEGAIGNTGDIEIVTSSLWVTDGGGLEASTGGRGDAGKISIYADTVALDRGFFRSSVLANRSTDSQGIGNSGGIEITTHSLFLNNASDITALTQGRGNAGKITIRATDTVSFSGISAARTEDLSAIVNTIAPGAVGNTEGIEIATESLILDRAFVGTNVVGQGDAGKITIQAANIVANNTFISNLIGIDAIGNSQGIDITTESFSIANSSFSTFSLGQGKAGNLSIQATNSIAMDDSFILSGPFSLPIENPFGLEPTNTGNGGDIAITTRSLSLNNSGLIAATGTQGDAGNIWVRSTDSVAVTGSLGFTTAVFSEGVGQGGNIDIETGNLFLGSGTSLLALTQGQGDAGQVRIRATDAVTLDSSRISTETSSKAGGNAQGIEITTDGLSLFNESLIDSLTNGQGDAGQVRIRATDAVILDSSRISASALSNAVGNARGIEITTNRLSLRNDALLDAFSSYDRGTAGEITVDANLIDLDRSFINASTLGGEGNLNLNSQELVLRNNSRIRTDAFGEATGGNIGINSDVIAALENSDISANAEEAFGGRITIATQGLFGTAFRTTQTPQSDITATSELGPNFSGTVEITPPEVDPASGLIGLPESPVDAASLVGKDFCSLQSRSNSEFIMTGRGGIPATPADPASPTTIWQDWSLTEIPETPTPKTTPEATSPEPPPLVEAQGWYVNEAGQVILTANPPTATPNQSGRVPVRCGGERE